MVKRKKAESVCVCAIVRDGSEIAMHAICMPMQESLRAEIDNSSTAIDEVRVKR